MEAIKYSKLINVGQFYGGLSGKTKEDFEDGNAKFITYMNVFSNPSLKTDIEDKVRIKEGEKQNVVKYGDVIFTGSSETPEECGMSSVLEEHTEEPLYLNSFCFGYRFNDIQAVVPAFFKHLFRSNSIRAKIAKTANGVTRFNVSKKLFGEIEIPLPPLPIQQETVRILDSFTSMITNLETELASRQKQYEYYRNKLLTFDESDESVEWKTLGEACNVRRGIRVVKSQLQEPNAPYPVFQNSIPPMGYYNQYNRDGNMSYIICAGSSSGSVGFCPSPFWAADDCFTVDSDKLNNRFIYYTLKANNSNLFNHVRGGGMPRLPQNAICNFPLPIPNLQRQQEIVSTLDTFELLISNIKQELEARKKQYEYYREKLLTFE